jgi:hypothetical protein
LKCDLKDFFVMALITLGWLASTVFLFLHAGEANFATWATWSGVVIGAYRWIDYKDSKIPDAGDSSEPDPH